ncbi:TetR/AcrR family transcriptional regulator [Roseivirga pacifica]|uniref:TetR/AcrR family transcriptional regulator n=1 Tax=Roseivirga pacifica TaxID=1267423 RepID=UPI0020953A7C|nr:TetR/AcrR family transcriptional regulator [Roseivirga pacifica]MCO6357142.1 TetR family transcriptional regulator [Roseivirga pacifica]MCO6368145.1 TetR family transcriptional regulator [Roseivirga pacifica]MCO6369374.1 TetR family transcriptional regulator [Roseivirga pacifica]MCO6373228.1 TetR family transcriptional regulator [Roseivirga pacifica]MCO6377515.1 TetR family transcriptional regulator [Roseivirga pacifica]
MKTKEKILATALELFNKNGLKEVTLRQIAKAMNISQGNLNYHYKVKSDIVSALYFQLVGRMNIEIGQLVQSQPIMSFLSESSLISMRVLYDYRFITKDLYAVLDSDDELKQHYVGLQQTRKQQFLALFTNMITEGLLRPEEFTNEYERLYERMNILGDNWINAAALLNNTESVVDHYHALLFEVIYPYLTEKGKEAFFKTQKLND